MNGHEDMTKFNETEEQEEENRKYDSRFHRGCTVAAVMLSGSKIQLTEKAHDASRNSLKESVGETQS